MSIEISVLLPTRGRVSGAVAAVRTLHYLASKPDTIEYLVRTDFDDQPVSEAILKGVPPIALTETRGPRLGYGRMHDYYTLLAQQARGKLLFVWNDDTEMLTQRWDVLLLEMLTTPVVQFIRRDTCTTADDTFPVVDRRIFEALGAMAQHCYVDTWLSKVSEMAGVRHFRNDIVFHHHRHDDQTQHDNAQELRSGNGHERWKTLDAERAADADKIKKLLEQLQGA